MCGFINGYLKPRKEKRDITFWWSVDEENSPFIFQNH